MLDLVREGRSFIPDALACTEGARQWGPSSSKRSASTTIFKEMDFVKHDPNKNSRGATKTAQVHVDVSQAALKRLHADFVEKDMFSMFVDVIMEAAFTALPRKVQEYPSLDDAAHQEEGSSLQCWTLCEPRPSHAGASPDGFVWDEDIQEYELVEVKTASRAIAAGLQTFEQVIGRGFADFIKEEKIDTNHKHYHQMTGQLALTGLGWCDLVVDWEVVRWVTRVPFEEQLANQAATKAQRHKVHRRENQSDAESAEWHCTFNAA
ncbi:hypothetical protein HPB47_003266 [Ixodes persulcatus]|uniref:Uncharacterized protein n=1 Tax=Ixodes persulcatus TaxID=34615 RepID=A0AC60PKE7_IXOPE|nr:hypothetical protein HPB47_003266 [Ixodes persulcatus]